MLGNCNSASEISALEMSEREALHVLNEYSRMKNRIKQHKPSLESCQSLRCGDKNDNLSSPFKAVFNTLKITSPYILKIKNILKK